MAQQTWIKIIIEVIIIFTTVISLYSGILSAQKFYSKKPGAICSKRGDPWFLVNLPLSLILALLISDDYKRSPILNFFISVSSDRLAATSSRNFSNL
ncbi:hypothetical protein PstZobell_13341 [Stutzerimonas stutzeri ATCC 14405 = CCUG 16156]|nr:hypothetical protein PstZobell_13341 [Stutzerimonas stutzeri ATCC 14405 = CCUG 16156]